MTNEDESTELAAAEASLLSSSEEEPSEIDPYERGLLHFERARSTVVELLAAPALRTAWLAIAREVMSGALAATALHSHARRDDGARDGKRIAELLRELCALLDRAAQATDKTFREPLPLEFVLRRQCALLRELAPEQQTWKELRRHLEMPRSAPEVRDVERALAQLSHCEGELVQLHLPLAHKMLKRFPSVGTLQEELLQEARIGLLRAARGYRALFGTRFTTYASHWLFAMMSRAAETNAGEVHVPSQVKRTLRQVERERSKIELEGASATTEVIAARTGVVPGRLERLLGLAPQGVISVDGAPEGADPVIVRAEGGSPESSAASTEQAERINRALQSLDKRSRDIIEQRFGLGSDGAEATLEELGKQHGITRERVRQLESKALEKLKKRLRELSDET